MTTRTATTESHVKLAAPQQVPAVFRSGGENMPLDYPHLYQIQAGDWRISYAVEHNRLAILVLEVLGADGGSSKDPKRADLTKKMKVKLLDWPEGTGSTQLPPEEISKKLKIKWLDLKEEFAETPIDSPAASSRIKLKGTAQKKATSQAGKSRITLLDSGETIVEEQGTGDEAPPAEGDEDRKVTPLDDPSM